MPTYRFRQRGARLSYGLSQDRAEHWLVSERDARTGRERCFRVAWEAVQAVLSLPDAARYAGASDLYHRQRIAEKSRESHRQPGGGNGKLVSGSR